MVKPFQTTLIGVDLVQYEIFCAKFATSDKGIITMNPTKYYELKHFDP